MKPLHALAAGLAAVCLYAPAHADDALKTAIASPSRTAAFAARDVWRHPQQTLEFMGIRPDSVVVELSPGAGWYTEILAPYLRDKGRLVLAGDDPASPNPNRARAAERMKQKFAAAPQLYDRVQMGVFEVPRKLAYAAPGSADLVLTFRNVHNWIAAGGDEAVRTVFRSAFDALKPGGSFGVVEHRLPAERSQDAQASTGYVHESYVIGLAESVGFKLAARSEINANPKDKAEHEGGVWALPPTLANQEKDRDGYLAIGESDRMTLRFVKP